MQYSEFVDKLKTGHVYTHAGGFRADDVVATALIAKVCEKENLGPLVVEGSSDYYREQNPGVIVHRVNDRQLQDAVKNSIVYDIGMGEFDHHQQDKPIRDNGIPYGSAGKIFDVVGKELFGDAAKVLDSNFIQPLDLCDNSEMDCPFCQYIRDMNPTWDEELSPSIAFDNALYRATEGINLRYEEASLGNEKDYSQLMASIEEDISENRNAYKEQAAERAFAIIEDAMKKTHTVERDGKTFSYIEVPKAGIPYKAIKEQTKNTDIVGYTYPGREGITFKPLNEDRITVPDRWKGASEFEIEGMTYCHPDGISLSFENTDSLNQAFNEMVGVEIEREAPEYDGEER